MISLSSSQSRGPCKEIARAVIGNCQFEPLCPLARCARFELSLHERGFVASLGWPVVAWGSYQTEKKALTSVVHSLSVLL